MPLNRRHCPPIERYLLGSSFDKKSSQVNMLRTRGKRVIAEATVPDALFRRVMHSSSELMYRARHVSNLGGFMSGVNNNGAHSANGITALFIATGQDVANVAESSAAYVDAKQRDNGDYYFSITIPALIVATYGGRTHLATQRKCGELSSGSAIVAEEWVEAHDPLGRNRRAPRRGAGGATTSASCAGRPSWPGC